MTKQKVLIVVGPTSSGKSALAVELAKKFDGEVISADSRQVYKGLDIGTGKVTKKETQGVAHHLLDVASARDRFTAKDYMNAASRCIDDIAARGKFPIVAGGTGFYIDALVGRIVLPDVAPDQELRAKLEKRSVAQLFAMLKKRDPRRAKTIDRFNKRRLIRALEIAKKLGKSPRKLATARYDEHWIGINVSQRELRKKITARLIARLSRGLVAEGKRLHAHGLSYKRMDELGLEYRWLAKYLSGTIPKDQMVWELERDIWHYADRQCTYWRRNKDIRWFTPKQWPKVEKNVRTWLRKAS